MFSDAAGTVPTLTTDSTNGFAATINVKLDGTTEQFGVPGNYSGMLWCAALAAVYAYPTRLRKATCCAVVSVASFCTGHLQHAKPFVYGRSANDAKLTVFETVTPQTAANYGQGV